MATPTNKKFQAENRIQLARDLAQEAKRLAREGNTDIALEKLLQGAFILGKASGHTSSDPVDRTYNQLVIAASVVLIQAEKK